MCKGLSKPLGKTGGCERAMGLRQALFRSDAGGDMGPIPLPGAPEISVHLKASARARRLSLRVSRLDGRVTLSLPRGVPRREAEAFVTEKADWIRGHLADIPMVIRPMPGATLLFEGREFPVQAVKRRGVAVTADGFEVPDSSIDATPARLAAFLKTAARDRLVSASERHATTIGKRIGRITLRDTRSRWGSCSPEGNLMYSWRLVMAPPQVLDYVAAHEVSHMVHMDHSQAFWEQCAALFPEHEAARRWLRTEGGALHRYRFRN